MWLYIPHHITDQEVIWNDHLPGAGHTEGPQGSTEKKQLCRCPPSPRPGGLHFLSATGNLTAAPGSMKSLPREFCRQLLFLESKQLGKVNRKPPVTRNTQTLHRQKTYLGLQTPMRMVGSSATAQILFVCNRFWDKLLRGQAVSGAIRTLCSQSRLPGFKCFLCNLPALGPWASHFILVSSPGKWGDQISTYKSRAQNRPILSTQTCEFLL